MISKCKVTKKNEYDKNDANKFQKEKDHFFSFRKYNSLTHSVESYEDEEEKIVKTIFLIIFFIPITKLINFLFFF